MTEKRYFSVDYDEEYYIFDSTTISEEEVLEKAEYSYDVFADSLMPEEIVNFLNENECLKKELEKFKVANHKLQSIVIEQVEEITNLRQKRDRYKRLSEISNEEINNRILTIQEFINNCSDEKVKSTLKDMFYSEVVEFDLSKRYRALEVEYINSKAILNDCIQMIYDLVQNPNDEITLMKAKDMLYMMDVDIDE